MDYERPVRSRLMKITENKVTSEGSAMSRKQDGLLSEMKKL